MYDRRDVHPAALQMMMMPVRLIMHEIGATVRTRDGCFRSTYLGERCTFYFLKKRGISAELFSCFVFLPSILPSPLPWSIQVFNQLETYPSNFSFIYGFFFVFNLTDPNIHYLVIHWFILFTFHLFFHSSYLCCCCWIKLDVDTCWRRAQKVSCFVLKVNQRSRCSSSCVQSSCLTELH